MLSLYSSDASPRQLRIKKWKKVICSVIFTLRQLRLPLIVMEFYKIENRDLEERLKRKYVRSDVGKLVSGSCADGLRSSLKTSAHQSDLDIMWVLSSMFDISLVNSGDVTTSGLVLDQLDSHAGYVRIMVIGECDQLSDMISNGYLISDLNVWQTFLQGLLKVKITGAEVDIHGPALRTLREGLKVDNVLTLICKSELPGIRDWADRARPSHWPPVHVIEDVTGLPTPVVPVGHPKSENKLLEWRISYSHAETEICRNISDEARSAYLKFKDQIKGNICNARCGEVIKSYHLKTTLFWVLEECGDADVEEEVYLLRLKEKLASFLQRRNIQHYFNPRINLVDHISQNDLSSVLQALTFEHPRSHWYQPLIQWPCRWVQNALQWIKQKTISFKRQASIFFRREWSFMLDWLPFTVIGVIGDQLAFTILQCHQLNNLSVSMRK